MPASNRRWATWPIAVVVSSSVESNGQVQIRPFGAPEWKDVPLVKPAEIGWNWGQGVLDLADAIREDRPQRATGEQAAHVVEVITSIHRSAKTNRAVAIASRFDPPPPMPWAEFTAAGSSS